MRTLPKKKQHQRRRNVTKMVEGSLHQSSIRMMFIISVAASSLGFNPTYTSNTISSKLNQGRKFCTAIEDLDKNKKIPQTSDQTTTTQGIYQGVPIAYVGNFTESTESETIRKICDRDKCKDVLDLDRIIRSSSDYRCISPNVAALALRKIIKFAFTKDELKFEKISRGYSSSAHRRKDDAVKCLIPILIQAAMKGTLSHKSDFKPTLTNASVTNDEEIVQKSINEFGVSDMLFFFSQILHRKSHHLLHELSQDNATELLIKNSLVPFITTLPSSPVSIEKFIGALGPHRLTETMHAIVMLRKYDECPYLLCEIVNRLGKGDALAVLTFAELTQIIMDTTVLISSFPLTFHPNDEAEAISTSSSLQNSSFSLRLEVYQSFMRRLRKRKVHQTLPRSPLSVSSYVTKAIWSCAKICQLIQYAKMDATRLRSEAQTLCHTLLRALLDENKRENSTTTSMIRSGIDYDGVLHNHETTRATSSRFMNENTNMKCAIQNLTSRQFADIMWACVTLGFDGEEPILLRLSDAVAKGNNVVTGSFKFGFLRDFAYTLASYEQIWWIGHVGAIKALTQEFKAQIEDAIRTERDLITVCNPSRLISILKAAMTFASAHEYEIANNICEAAALMLLEGVVGGYNEQHESVRPLDCTTVKENLFSKNRREKSPSFLSKCNDKEVSMITWLFVRCRWWPDDNLMRCIEHRMLQSDMLGESGRTSASASRFLWSYANLLSRKVPTTESECEEGNKSVERQVRMFEVFHCVSSALLTNQLSPRDASAAMWAMAKVSYTKDLGIFDFMAEIVSKEAGEGDSNTSSSKNKRKFITTKDISRALWACGKMIAWEVSPGIYAGNTKSSSLSSVQIGYDPSIRSVKTDKPPYWNCAKDYAALLRDRVKEMTPKDLAQSVWGIGRLDINEQELIVPLVESIVSQTDGMNCQEIANILWGLSTIGYDDQEDHVPAIAKCMTKKEMCSHCTSQEASNVLLALGRLKIRDEAVFMAMSDVIMHKLHEATPQGIANVLWAHHKLNLEPPQELFDCWAKQKLGLKGAGDVDFRQEELQ